MSKPGAWGAIENGTDIEKYWIYKVRAYFQPSTFFHIKWSIEEMKWNGAGPHHITQIQIAVMKSSVKK